MRVQPGMQLIVSTFQYDYRLFVEDIYPDEYADVIYSAYKMINDTTVINGHPIGGYPRGVCQAYAMYGYIMLKEAGYNVITIEGNAGDDNQPHVWNLVKVGAYWYHLDFTWNDPITSNLNDPDYPEYTSRQNGVGTVSLNYFLKSDSTMRKDHSWVLSSNGFTYPLAPKDWTGVLTPSTTPTPKPVTKAPTKVPTKVLTPTTVPTITLTDSSDDIYDGENSSSLLSDDKNSTNNESDLSALNDDLEQTVTITGQLLDSDGNPIPNKAVELFATSTVVITDMNGKFKFENVKIGNYKIYVRSLDGETIEELPVIISFGEITEYVSGELFVNGGVLNIDLVLDVNGLHINSVSSPSLGIKNIIIIIIALIILISILSLIGYYIKMKSSNNTERYLE